MADTSSTGQEPFEGGQVVERDKTNEVERDTVDPTASSMGSTEDSANAAGAVNHSSQASESVTDTSSQDRKVPDGSNGDGCEPSNELIKNWKTSYGFSVLGIVAYVIAFFILVMIVAIILEVAGVPALHGNHGAQAGSIVAIIYGVLTLVYVGLFQTSYFAAKPRVSASKTVSFLNLFFGGIIFGAWWNRRLTLCKRGQTSGAGMSGTVFAIISAIGLVAVAYLAYNNISVYPYYGSNANGSNSQTISSQSSASNVSPTSSEESSGSSKPKAVHFKDKKYGVSFTVPKDWYYLDTRKEKGYKSTRLVAVPQDNYYAEIDYGIEKFESDNPGMDELSAAQVEPWMSSIFTNPKNMHTEKVKAGSRQYWRLTATATGEYKEGKRQMYVDMYVRWAKGHLYKFVYTNGSKGVKNPDKSTYHKDFDRFMKSVKCK